MLRHTLQRHSGLVRLAVPGHGRRVWSAGSFFAFEPVFCLCGNQSVSRATRPTYDVHTGRGCFEINPPFTLSGNHVSDHMGRILQRARFEEALTFVMVHARTRAARARRGCSDSCARRLGWRAGGTTISRATFIRERSRGPTCRRFRPSCSSSRRRKAENGPSRGPGGRHQKAFAWPRVKSKPAALGAAGAVAALH